MKENEKIEPFFEKEGDFVDYDPSYIDVETVKKFIKKLKIPKEYFKINLDKFFSNDYNIYISIRENAGKTTQALILGMVLNRLYGTKIEYLRCDEDQIRRAGVEELFNTVESLPDKFNNYIQLIYDNKYNAVEYKSQVKSFRLIHIDDDGNIDLTGDTICAVHSNENYRNFKSTYNSPKGDYIIFDEFIDSKRPVYHQMTELCNNISTIGRVGSKQRGNNVHVLMLGNNTDEYSHWWDDFTITEKVRNMEKFGSEFEVETEIGATVYCKLIDINDNKKRAIEKKKIKFFGFNTPEMAQFNGTQVWAQTNYPQIPDVSMLREGKRKKSRIYIYHRGRYIQLELFSHKLYGYYVFLHWASEPEYDDAVIMTIEPIKKNEIYGFGEYSLSGKVGKALNTLNKLRKGNRWYYLNNQIGAIVEDFIKSV